MSAVPMSEVFGSKRDVITDCRQQMKGLSSNGKFRISAELVLKNGDRRFFNARAIDKTSAIREILTFVAAVEEATGEQIMWRLKGDKTYHFSTNYTTRPSILNRAKSAFLNYFFDLEV
jgi:Family of unknown function (DUF6018)